MKTLKRLARFTAVLALAAFLPACGTEPSDGTLTTEDLVVGTGPTVVSGDTVTVTYIGSLASSGTVFETNTNGFTTRIGVGLVIKGWDQGIIGMRVGGTRRLTIPPNLAYGSQASAKIPANSTLKFDIGLLAIAGK